MKRLLSFHLNGDAVDVLVEPHHRLVDVLRNQLRTTGTKEGCGEGECGACTVMVDGLAVNACLFPALEAEGFEVTTIEGLAGEGGGMGPLQLAFVQAGAIQCGFCTPGMIMASHALLQANPNPSDDEIREALQGNLCRCTGYVQIIAAVKLAASMGSESATGAGHD